LVGEPFDDFPASPRPVSFSINAGLQQASRVDVVRVSFLTSNRELMPAGASSRQRSAGSNPPLLRKECWNYHEKIPPQITFMVHHPDPKPFIMLAALKACVGRRFLADER